MTQDQSPLPELPDEEPLDTDSLSPDPPLPLSETPDPFSNELASSSSRPPITAENQDVLSQLPPIIKAPTIKALRSTIQALEGIVTRLETTPAPTIPASPSYWQQGQKWWTTLMTRIRSVLPSAINQSLSDRALSGAIAGIFLLVVWSTSSLLFHPSKPTPVAVLPLASPAPSAADQVVSSPIPMPSLPPIAPGIEPTTPPTVEPTIAPELEPLSPPPVSDNRPDTLSENPVIPSPSPTVAPSPLPPPPPPLRLTPEQKLIAQIQDQVAEISNQYVNGLIQSVQANFRSSRLIVKLSDDWYSLPALQQDQLANDMLRRAQELDFSKLELTDATGISLARSPVIGTEMIILQRTTTAVTAA